MRVPLPILLLLAVVVAAPVAGAEPPAPAEAPPAEAAPAEPPPVVAIVGARVLPVDRPAIEDGVVLLRGDRIEAVGRRGDLAIPEGAETIEGAGLVLTPGLVDAASELFLGGNGAGPSSFPDARATDGADPFDADAAAVLRAGVTAVFLDLPPAPGVNGAGATVRTHVPEGADGLSAVPGAPVLKATLGVGRGADPGPIARILESRGILASLRAAEAARRAREKYEADLAAYEKAMAERAKAEEGKKDGGQGEKKDGAPAPAPRPGGPAGEVAKSEPPRRPVPPPPNAAADPLVPVLERTALLRIEARGAEAILAALSVAEEYPVRLVIAGADEAGRVRANLAEARVPVVLGPILADDPKAAVRAGLAADLVADGVRVAIATGGRPGRASRFLPLHAAAAVAAGLPRDAALRAITLDAARAIGVEAEIGSIARGKAADLVLWSGDPLDSRTRAVRVIVGGKTVHEARP